METNESLLSDHNQKQLDKMIKEIRQTCNGVLGERFFGKLVYEVNINDGSIQHIHKKIETTI